MEFLHGHLWLFLSFGVSALAWGLHFAKLPSFLTVLLASVCLGFFGVSHDTPSSSTQFLVELATALLFLFVGHEATHASHDRKVVAFAWHSSWPPMLFGVFVAFFYLQTSSFASAWVIGAAFALSALPILSMWLEQFKAPLHDRAVALQSVAWTDVVAWCGLALALDFQRMPWLFLMVGLGLLGLWVIRKQPWWAFLAFYFGWFFACHAMHVHGLLWAIVAAMAWKKWGRSHINWESLKPVVTWGAIPLVLVSGLSALPAPDRSWTPAFVLLLVGLPMAARMGAVAWAKKRVGVLSSPYPWSVLLNTRGLTEIVFLTAAHQGNLLSSSVYSALVLMAVIGTVLPIFWRGPSPLFTNDEKPVK